MTWYKQESWGIEEICLKWDRKQIAEWVQHTLHLPRELLNSLSYLPNPRAAAAPYKAQDYIVWSYF